METGFEMHPFQDAATIYVGTCYVPCAISYSLYFTKRGRVNEDYFFEIVPCYEFRILKKIINSRTTKQFNCDVLDELELTNMLHSSQLPLFVDFNHFQPIRNFFRTIYLNATTQELIAKCSHFLPQAHI